MKTCLVMCACTCLPSSHHEWTSHCSLSQAVTTLVSMNDNDMVDMNIDAVLTPLTEKEREVMDHMEKNFFRPLKQRHWEGVEPAQYWKVMREQGLAS